MSTNTRPRTTRGVDSVAVIAKWMRRVGFPLAILAWTGVAQVISLSGYMRFLLTSGKSGQLTPLEQTLRSPGLSQSQVASARDKVEQTVGETPSDPEAKPKLPS